MPRRQYPSCTRHQFVPSLYSGHVITYSRMFPFPSTKQPFCRMMACYQPHAPLPNALRKISCRMVFLYQTRPQVSPFPVPIFGVNICPFNYGIKSDFISELTINAQCLQAESVQHPSFPPANRWSLRSDPNPSSSILRAQTNGGPRPGSSGESHPPKAHSILLFSNSILDFSFCLFLFLIGSSRRNFDSRRGPITILFPRAHGNLRPF
jgi:hypothetical protein